ncbi:MAG: protein-L-isoaspartate(D-aspartate) O-methyltransferase [Planctomycetes bacterium]|nr:protein-L-isoaspartate(D-aspartate) O-methyltransferase [Planctomycetota bacterium]
MRSGPTDFAAQRAAMVEEQLRARGIRDPRVLRVMGALPRELFVPEEIRERAYEDNAQPLSHGATISQPYIVAAMTEALALTGVERVLDLGTGSGYQAAILAELVPEVFSVELMPELATSAAERLARLGYRNVAVRAGDGRAGWPEHAPYDAILCAAAADDIPAAWLEQLREGGRCIAPLESGDAGQQLQLLEKRRGRWRRKSLFPVRFVPLR